MFRQIAFRSPQIVPLGLIRGQTVPRITSVYTRPFSSCSLLLKKAKKGAKVVEEETSKDLESSIDFEKVKEKLQDVVDRFAKHANDAKLGKTNPKVFDHLIVKTAHGESPYSSLAQTNVKGRNFIMTVYDPANVQCIINSVLGSDLNLNPVADPNNKLTLRVPLPPITTDLKKESIKDLKATYEKLRNGTSSKLGSLSSIRADTRHKFSKSKKLSDSEKIMWDKYELVHKEYVNKLAALMKSAEEAIMK